MRIGSSANRRLYYRLQISQHSFLTVTFSSFSFLTKVASSSDANSDSTDINSGKCEEKKTPSNADADVDRPVARSFSSSEVDSTITFRTFTNNGSDESSAALISLKVENQYYK